MSTFNLNGQMVTTPDDANLLEYLREDAKFTSVKNGCAEGACGACMVLVDGKATRACLLKASKLEGKTVLTVEGFPERDQNALNFAFAQVGAVQCGFCIPGMVVSAKGLLDKNPAPSISEIKEALKFNLCRCTGYVKIEKAIQLAAEYWQAPGKPIPVDGDQAVFGLLGDPIHRVDAYAKTSGTGLYADDLNLPGMLYGRVLRAPVARALIKKINISEAEKLPGVVTVMLAKDVPGERFIGHLSHIQDWPAMIAEGEETRYVGDALALVAASSKAAAAEALKLIKVDYEALTPLDATTAQAEGAPKIHPNGNILAVEKLFRGDPEGAIKNARYVVSNTFELPFTEHAFLEPECAVAEPDGDGGVVIYTGSQSIYDDQRECSRALGLPPEKVRVRSMLVGGGFGGKEDMSVQHHAALLAYKTKQPVKVLLSRQESIDVHPKRHAMKVEMTTACNENGLLTGMRCRIISDTGAYASLGGPVLQRACTHAAGPYNYQNVDIIGTAVYTNNPPGGAFRGFGVTQTVFATECNLNQLAKMAGLSDWEIRHRNALRPGDVMPNGQIADETTAFVETLMSVKDDYEKAPLAGIGCALKNAGVGVGIPDIGRCRLEVRGGKIYIYTSAACIGQGMATMATQMVSHYVGVHHQLIVAMPPDTANTPDSGTTTASRQTVFTGEAAKQAALKLKEALNGKTLEGLNGQDFYAEYLGETDPMGSPKPNPVSHVAYGYATHLVIMNPEDGKIEKIIAAHDVGRAVNPQALEGQIEGGVVTGMGYALTEDFPLKDGVPQAKFATLGLLKAPNVPPIEARYMGRQATELAGGAKGVGEISSIPTAPALQGAYFKKDGIFRTKLPLEDTPYSRKKKVV